MLRVQPGPLLLPLLFCLFVTYTATPVEAQIISRQQLSIDQGWRFQRGDPVDAGNSLSYVHLHDWMVANGNEFSTSPATQFQRPVGNPGEGVSYLQPGFDDHAWRQLDLPHDWAIEQPFEGALPGETGKLPYSGVGWYRHHLGISKASAKCRYYLDVDGAMSYATVWCNGQFVGGWPYGYSSFELDLSSYLHEGDDNVLAIRLENPPTSSRWYPGAGINRNVWLVRTDPVHVEHWGVTVTTPHVSDESADVLVRTLVTNTSADPANIAVRTQLFPLETASEPATPRGTAVAEIITASEQPLPPGRTISLQPRLRIARPHVWDTQAPHRYVAVTTVLRDGAAVDIVQTPFGIRTLKFTPDDGFLLNGRRVQLQGVCDHGDLGALGAVANVAGYRRQLEILRSFGCNALRTAHNPPAPELLELCDETGMLVMDESFDCWAAGKNPNDYHLLWNDWHEKDWRAELRRDRNHPCIIMWSSGNEMPDLTTRAGPDIAKQLTAIAHEEDPTRPVTFACDQPEKSVNPGMVGTGDLWGENYRANQYAVYRKDHPGLIVFGTETASTFSSRGEYFFPDDGNPTTSEVNFQVSSYDLTAPWWGNTPDEEFNYLDRQPYLLGEFVWTGFDYLGEPTPYNSDPTNLLNFSDPVQRQNAAEELKRLGKLQVPSRSSYFGIVDLCGFPKDRFYLYQSRWKPDLPMAHLLPHWNWEQRRGMVTPVHVYTSGDEAELFLNGRSLGRKKKNPFEYRLRWDDVKYEPGELKVIAYKQGQLWAQDVENTTGPAAGLHLTPDRAAITADGQDLAFVTVKVVDTEGLTVPRSHPRIDFTVDGPGEIVTVDNGDPTDLQPFRSATARASDRCAFNGLALVILRTTGSGDCRLTARSPGLQSTSVVVRGELPGKR